MNVIEAFRVRDIQERGDQADVQDFSRRIFEVLFILLLILLLLLLLLIPPLCHLRQYVVSCGNLATHKIMSECNTYGPRGRNVVHITFKQIHVKCMLFFSCFVYMHSIPLKIYHHIYLYLCHIYTLLFMFLRMCVSVNVNLQTAQRIHTAK